MKVDEIKKYVIEQVKYFANTNREQYKLLLLNLINNQIMKDENIDNAERLEILFEILLAILDIIEIREYMRENYTNIIDYPQLFNKYHKKAVATEYVTNRIKALEKRSPTERKLFLQNIATAIKNYDSELSNKILRIVIKDTVSEERYKQEVEVLNEIIKIITENEKKKTPESIPKEIREKLPQLEPMFKAFGDRKTLKEIKDNLLALSGEEVLYLERYLKDLERWPNYIYQGQSIDFFIKRVRQYLEGDRITPGSVFKGIQSYFKDTRLVKEIHKDVHLKRLLMFIEELKFFDWARHTVLYASQRPGWEGFLGHNGFYYNLRKGKNYIKTVREKYGNEQLASLLEKVREKIHEQPIAWVQEFAKIEKQLQNKQYQYEEIVKKAAQPLMSLFSERIKELKEKEITSLEELKKALTKRIHELKKEADSFVKKMKRSIEKKKREIEVELLRKRVELEKILFKDKYIRDINQFTIETCNWFVKVKDKRTNYREVLGKELGKRRQLGSYTKTMLSKAISANDHVTGGLYVYAMVPYFNLLANTIEECENYEAKLLFMEEDDTKNCIKLIHKGLDIVERANEIAAIISKYQNDFIADISKPNIIQKGD